MPCATQADVRAAVDQQTLISKLDQQTYGLADSTYAINNAITSGFYGVNTALANGFHGVDNAICNLGYQNQQGFNALGTQIAQNGCDTRAAIKDCCCENEKIAMQSRFDAQAYNCNTLQAIDKLGDRIIDYMNAEKTQALRDELQTLRLQASQAAQNNFFAANQEAQTAELIRRIAPTPTPAYVVPNPNCCYPYTVPQCASACAGM